MIDISSLIEDATYYINAKARDVVDNISNINSSDGFKMDLSPPVVGSIIVPSTINNLEVLPISWSGLSDNKSGINRYEYSLGSMGTGI